MGKRLWVAILCVMVVAAAGCTKKHADDGMGSEPVEGSRAASEGKSEAPPDEMQEKEKKNADPAEAPPADSTTSSSDTSK